MRVLQTCKRKTDGKFSKSNSRQPAYARSIDINTLITFLNEVACTEDSGSRSEKLRSQGSLTPYTEIVST